MREFWLFVGVTAFIGVAFGAGVVMYVPHPNNLDAQHAAIFAGLASALAWGQSVVGALLGARHTIPAGPVWNSWFNVFAAAFAAMAAGLTSPWL